MRKAQLLSLLALTVMALPAMAGMCCPGGGSADGCGTKGTISSIDYQRLTLVLHTNSGDVNVQATNQTRIMVQGNCHADFSDLKTRMTVSVMGTRNGNTIQATSICECRPMSVNIE